MHPHEGNGSPEDRRLQIAVAGGSIGGLCAGLALHGSGFDVNVYERHPGPMDTRGAGIVVQGELVQLLDTYGAPPLPTTSCRVRRYLDPKGGDGQVQSMPQAFTSWEAIYETLRAAFPKERYHMGATLVGVNDPGDGQAVAAEIEGHGHIKTDLLVCADGAQSPTRRRLLPDVLSIYAGYVAWRGTLDEADAPKELVHFFEDAFTFSEARSGGHILTYFIPGAGADTTLGRRRLNWVWYVAADQDELGPLLIDRDGRQHHASLPQGGIPQTTVQVLVDRARHEVHPKLAELVAATPDPFAQTIVDVVVPRTVFGRVCHPIGPKLAAKMAEAGLYDPKQPFPQTNDKDLICYREFFDLDYAMPKQCEEGVTLSLASNGGEVEWFARDLLKVSTGDALKILNDEYLEIRDRFPGEFALMANAHALKEDCRPIVEDMIGQGGAKAIAVASSYGDGSDRIFLDSPKAEWLWEFAEANDIVVHIHPPMGSIGHESLMQYRLNEAVGRPFDSTVNGARMIGSGVFDRHPKLQVLIVHMGGGLASVLGRLEFNWRLNYNGILDPPAGRPYTNKRSPSEYFKTNILVDCMGFNPIGLRAAVEMCGVDRVVFGSDYGPIPYGIKEHVQIVEDVLPSPAERELVFWKTSSRIFRLGLVDTDLVTL